MITNLSTVLKKAKAEKQCIPAINVYNLETVQAVFDAVLDLQVPIIVSFGESYLSHAPLKVISLLVHSLDSSESLPVVLHLDHAQKIETIEKALDCGFTSVMYDGSRLPLKQNIENTRKAVEISRSYGASVEAELGYLNSEDGRNTEIIPDRFTRVEDAIKLVKTTEIDALAVAVGNAHGCYSDDPELDFERIAAISNATGISLVLHGSSGIPEKDLKKAISLGVTKINVNTEVSLAGAASISSILGIQKNIRLETLMTQAKIEMTAVIKKYIKLAYF